MDKVIKTMLWIIGLLFVVGMFAQFTSSAQPTYQYAKIYMDPLYRQFMEQDISYDYNLHIDTPDGMGEVVNAMVTMQLWLNPTISFEVLVDGQHCNNPTFEVHTTYAGAGEGTIYFDCSNVITGEGDYVVSMIPDDDTGASTFWVDLTYSNAPKGTVEVHGTEYAPHADALIWLQLLNSTGHEVNNGACQIDIHNPDGSEFIEMGAMTNIEHSGIYMYPLTAPQAQGVYPAVARCFYDISETSENADGFTLNTGTVDDKTYLETYLLDGDEHKLRETDGLLDFEYNFDNMCGTDITEDLLTGVSITTNAKWKDTITNDDITIYFYNYTSSSWQALPNKIIVPNDRVTVTNFIETNNVTKDGLVSPTGTMELKYNDTIQTIGATEKIEVDWVDISCVQYSNPIWTEVKGSSEMHISSDKYWVIDEDSVTGNITNETYLGYMYFDMTVSSQTSSLKEEQDVYFESPTPFPCHHILNVTVEGVDTDWWGVDTGGEACEIHWEQDLEPHTNYDVQIKSENWWKLEIRGWENEVDTVNGFFAAMCNFYALENDYPPYIIPKQEKLNDSYDNFYKSCSSILDYYDHINESLENEYSFDEAVLSFEQMALLNANWRHLSITIDQYNAQANDIMETLGVATDMSIAALGSGNSEDFFYFWANESTPYLIYQQTNATVNGLANISVDTSAIADSVWAYDGTVSSNIMSQFAQNIWNYTDRQLTAFSFAIGVNETLIADAIWASPVRTLTSFDFLVGLNSTSLSDIWNYVTRGLTEQVEVNWTEGAEYIWNNPERNLTSFDFVVDANVDWETGAEFVWNSTTRGLTEAVEANVDWSTGAEFTWNATTRELTAIQWDHETAALYNWNSTTRDLTVSPFDPAAIANATWNYADRSLSEFDFVVDTTVDYAAISNYVWNNTQRDLTFYDHETSALYNWNSTTRELTAAPFDADIIANATWNYADRQLTDFGFTVDALVDWETGSDYVWNASQRDLTFYDHETSALYNWNSTTRDLTVSPFDPAAIANATWNYADRQLTGFTFEVDVDYDTIAANVWNDTERELTFYDHANGAAYVWNETTRELTESPFDPAAIANATWNYADRSLSEFDFTVETVMSPTEIATYVWNATQRDLTFYDHSTGAEYVWNETTRELTESPFDPNAIANATWNYADRQLTAFSFTVDATVDAALIGEYVWNETTRGLTENTNPNVDWTTGAQFVWNSTTRELTAISWDHENAAAYVWNSTTRNLTDSPFDPAAIASAVWAYTDRNLTYLNWAEGSDYVWNNTDRQLTSFPFVVDATINNSELVFDVWAYADRELTASPFDPAAIANATWNYADRELTGFTFTVDTTLNESELSTLTTDQVWSYYQRSLTEAVAVDINTTAVQEAIWNAPARYTHGVILN